MAIMNLLVGMRIRSAPFPYDFTSLVKESKTLYAGWLTDEDAYATIIFDGNGGKFLADLSEKSQTIRAGNPVLPLPGSDLLRPNYSFRGWFQDKECTILYDFSQPLTSNVRGIRWMAL